MVMLCTKNGSLARKSICEVEAEGNWETFNEKLQSTEPGNTGHVGFYFMQPEITPDTSSSGVYRFGPDDVPLSQFSSEV